MDIPPKVREAYNLYKKKVGFKMASAFRNDVKQPQGYKVTRLNCPVPESERLPRGPCSTRFGRVAHKHKAHSLQMHAEPGNMPRQVHCL